MRDTRRGRRPQVEPLEAMTLLSGVTAMVMPETETPTELMATTSAVVSKTPIPEIVALNGKAFGSYSSSRKIPDAGTTYTLNKVAGTFTGYGKGVVTGTLTTPGFIMNAKATGALKVSLTGGTVTLALTSAPQKSFSGLPSKFSYVIVHGTGKFQNAAGDPTGRGVINVSSKASSSVFTLFKGHGKIALAFHAQPVALA
jgi:hypothetical protein